MWQNRTPWGPGSVSLCSPLGTGAWRAVGRHWVSRGRMRGSGGGGSYLQLAVRADLTERRSALRRDVIIASCVTICRQRIPGRKSKQHWPWKNEAGGLQARRGPLTPKSNSFFQSPRGRLMLWHFTACLLLLKSLLRWSPFTTLLDLLCQQPLQTFSLGLSPRPTHFLWFPLNISPLNSRHSSHSVFSVLSSPNQKLSLLLLYLFLQPNVIPGIYRNHTVRTY